jgi:hypothetical protein
MAAKKPSKRIATSPSNMLESLIRAWTVGSPIVRAAVIFVVATFLLGLVLQTIGAPIFGQSSSHIQVLLYLLAGLVAWTIRAYQAIKREQEFNKKVEIVEERASKNPEQAAPAWELARLNLEKYLDRNLGQVKWIFLLVVAVMSCGFGIIIYGIWRLYQAPTEITPALISAASGILSQFIGATFLFIYRSTLAQAKDYVAMLERINAVGMSVQILDGLERSNPDLRDKAKVTVAQELLKFYAGTTVNSPPSRKRTTEQT